MTIQALAQQVSAQQVSAQQVSAQQVSAQRALVLGGTEFAGRHLVTALLAGGAAVSLFNRALTNPGLFPAAEQLVGDRHADVAALVGREWDVVYDLSAYHPDDVVRCGQVLAGHTGHYVFVSTISAYADLAEPGVTEDAPLAELTGPIPEKFERELYGPLKALCEARVVGLFPGATIIRPTIIVGPHDPTDRFTYWVQRLSEPGAHLMPPDVAASVQYIDARDLGDFMVLAGTRRLAGPFNLAAPPVTFTDLVAAIAAETGASVEPISLGVEELAAAGVAAWSDLPLVISTDEPELRGMFQVTQQRAAAAGLMIRPLRRTVRDILDWLADRGDVPLRTGLSPQREAELVARYGR